MIISPKCIAELRAKHHSFPPKMRKVAEYIIDHPDHVINNSIQELSALIGVSQYSVLNCVRAVGFRGFSDFKISLAMGVQQIEVTGDPARGELAGSTTAGLLQETFESNARALLDTAQLLDPACFARVVELIFQAKRTGVYGLGFSAYAAQYLCNQLVRLGFHAIAVTDASYQLLDAMTLIEADLLVCFSVTGDETSIAEAFRIARKNRCCTVAVACVQDAPLGEIADLTLHTTSSGPRHTAETDNAIVEQISLASALVTAVYRDMQKGRQRTI